MNHIVLTEKEKDNLQLCNLRQSINRSCRDCILLGTECKPLNDKKPQYNPIQNNTK